MEGNVMNALHQELEKVDEPAEAKGYADVLSRVASEGQPVILRREGNDLAAIVPLSLLEELRDALAMEEAQQKLRKLDLLRLAKENPPPQSWFDNDEPKPF
jgi:antitoxin (DNA-binding transcriptional repressor) of toxin-antitoxin stability system